MCKIDNILVEHVANNSCIDCLQDDPGVPPAGYVQALIPIDHNIYLPRRFSAETSRAPLSKTIASLFFCFVLLLSSLSSTPPPPFVAAVIVGLDFLSTTSSSGFHGRFISIIVDW